MKKFILLIAISCCFKISYTQPGTLDPSFGNKGIVYTDFGAIANSGAVGRQVLMNTDGSLYLIVGTSNYITSDEQTLIIRILANGIIDSSYGNNGYSQLVGIAPVKGALQSDGKIIVAGSTGQSPNDAFALARYNTDGTLDSTFSEDGKQTTDFGPDAYGSSVAIQSDGKIVVAGGALYGFALVRYNTDGSLDKTFSQDGKLTTNFDSSYDVANSVAKIIAAGSVQLGSNLDFAIVRYNTDGTLDTAFSQDGKQTTDFGSAAANSVAIQRDGKIVVAGSTVNLSNNDFALARYNTDGTLDTTFSQDGKQTTDFANNLDDRAQSIAIQNDGKIVVIGATIFYGDGAVLIPFALVRYNADGSLDTTFSEDGKQTTNFGSGYDAANSIAIQRDGKIVVAGSTEGYNDINDIALARYNTDGSLDTTFSRKQTTDFTSGSDLAIQSDGKIVVVGNSGGDFALARYNPDGCPDTTFSQDGKYFPAYSDTAFH